MSRRIGKRCRHVYGSAFPGHSHWCRPGKNPVAIRREGHRGRGRWPAKERQALNPGGRSRAGKEPRRIEYAALGPISISCGASSLRLVLFCFSYDDAEIGERIDKPQCGKPRRGRMPHPNRTPRDQLAARRFNLLILLYFITKMRRAISPPRQKPPRAWPLRSAGTRRRARSSRSEAGWR